ncbi:MAG: hypothetical protein RIQ93_2520 [Verrucomicrobiota bacterium]|jgi:hypothetical protein
MRTKPFLQAALIAAVLFPSITYALEQTWTYSVQVTATVLASPPTVILNWVTDELPATEFTIRRKAPGERFWGPAETRPPGTNSYVDENVRAGEVYEYQIEKQAAQQSAYGYISVAVYAPLVESRGKVILIVDNTVAAPLATELKRLEQDLVGDGWSVVRKNVERDDSPASIRRTIQGEYLADPANVEAVFLFGHIPVVRSGNSNVDGHQARPLPADVYYGEMNGNWTDANGDGVLDQNTLPSDAELQVGRVDFYDLPGAYAPTPFPTEIDLLRRYLNKDHAFRHAQVRPPARALMGNVAGDGRGQAYAASGYRNFAPLVGPENVIHAATELTDAVSERWITKLATSEYLWVYGCGGGSDFGMSVLGAHGEYNEVWGADFIEQKAKGTFYLLFGSWYVDWSKSDNFMRTVLAAPDYGLTASWSGRPHHFYHHMGSGETVGYGIRLTQNNDGSAYRNQVQRQLRGIHIALLGDPTLRQHQVAPPRDVTASVSGDTVAVGWQASPDPVLGYRVYRSSAPGAPFVRISGELHPETKFIDRPEQPRDATYMVRAITLQVGPSGAYYNGSEGIFSRADFAIPTDPPAAASPQISGGKLTGFATEIASDIRHPNGNIFDQVLMQGATATMTADPGQILRVSFLDPSDDIVQVEFSGAGAMTIMLDQVSPPAAPTKYNQTLPYAKGLATIAIVGANETSHVSIFSVGPATAVAQNLFRPDVSYDGMADIACLSIASANGTFGSISAGNTRFSAAKALTGLFAPEVRFNGPVVIGDIVSTGSAIPVLYGAASDVRIAGGSLAQANQAKIQVNSIRQLHFTSGSTSHGTLIPARSNQARFDFNGADFTAEMAITYGP